MSNTDMRAALTVTADASALVAEMRRGSEGLRELKREAEAAAAAASLAASEQGRMAEKLNRTFSGFGASQKSARDSAGVFEANREFEAFRREQADQAARAYRAIEESLNPVIRAERELAAAQAVVNRAFAAGQITNTSAARSLQDLQDRYDRIVRAQSPAAQSAQIFEAALAAQAAEIRNLTLALDPAARETERFEQAQLRLKRAMASGIISDDEHNRLQALLAEQKRATGGGAGAGAAASAAGNLSFQMNDVLMMTAMGQSPLMLVIQQGPQVAQIFSQIQASGMSMGAALSGAFKMMLTPWGLLAMGVIGGGAAIAQGLVRVIPTVKSLEERMAALNTEFDRYKEVSAISAASAADLARDFGAGAEAAQGLYLVLSGLSRIALDDKLKKSSTAVREMIGMTAGAQLRGRDGSNFTGYFGLGTGYANVSKHSDEIGSFYDALKGFEKADGIEAQTEAMQVLLQQVEYFSTLQGGISDKEQQLITLLKEQADVLLGIQGVETAQQERRRREIDEMVRGYAQQAELSRTALQYGEDSAEVEAVRARQAREALQLRLDEMGAAQDSEEAQRAMAGLEAELAASSETRAQARQRAADALMTDLQRQGELSSAVLRFGEDSAEVEALRALHAREVNDERLKEMGLAPGLLAMAQDLFAVEQQRARQIRSDEAGRKADQMVVELREQAEINRAITAHGRDSLQVKELQIAAERRAYAEQLKTLEIGEERKAQMMAEWEQARGLASADPFGQIAASREILRSQAERVQQLKLEQALLGQSEATRSRILALWKAEQDIRRQGIDASSERARMIREAAAEEDALTRAVQRQADAWRSVQSAAENAMDGIFDKLMDGDWKGALEEMAKNASGVIFDLSVRNPAKNATLGKDLPTMADIGGLSGIWGLLTRRGDGADIALPEPITDVATMDVMATTVVIGGPGAMSLLGNLPGAANAVSAPGGLPGLTGSASVQEQAWRFFAAKGMKPHQIAGIMGNISGESGFNPLAEGDGGDAHGLFQWNDRRHKLFDFIGGKGNLGNVQGQLEFAWQELQTTESAAYKRLMASTDVRGATDAFMRGFERPSEKAMVDSWGARLGAAEEALTRFGGTAQTATTDLSTLGSGMGGLGDALAGALGGGGNKGAGWVGVIASLGGKALGIPGFAAGGDHFGGLRVVGEKGPELEFTGPSRIMNAELTRQLLSARSTPMAANSATQVDRRPVIQVINNSSARVTPTVEETTDSRGQRQYRLVMDDAVAAAVEVPGGRTQRAMRAKYGLSQAGVRR